MAEPRDSKSTDKDAAQQGEPTEPKTSESTIAGSKGKKGKKPKTGDPKTISPTANMTNEMAESMLEMNPALKAELGNVDKAKAAEMLRKMDISELLTGLSLDNKNRKDMASFKFWQTQPVVRFDDKDREKVVDGPIKKIDPEQVSKEPDALIEGFEWSTLDVTDDKELEEIHELLNGHFVEDQSATFRLNYSLEFLKWALKSPGWRKEWHVGVRASKSRKLVAFICGLPTEISVRGQTLKVTEINFLCIHKKLRSKRLAPVLIKEITRRCYLNGIYQAIYTAGVVLPTPVSSCRYYHRPLDWLKLYEVGFSPLPTGSTKARQISKNHLPSQTATPGLRAMQAKDVDAVHDLLNRYHKRFDLAQTMSRSEADYLLVHRGKPGAEQVIYSYVVEEPGTHKITDFVSFYSLDSRVIEHEKYTDIRAAYLYYYAAEAAFAEKEKGLKERLQAIMNDALILAKKAKFDVFNAITAQDNPLFLEHLKFGAGDGQLHYYLFNYRTAPIAGGVNDKNLPDERKRGGVGVILF